MTTVTHFSLEELEAGLDTIRQSPSEIGDLQLIVRRPAANEREVLQVGELDLNQGLMGDNWGVRGSSRTKDGSSHPDMQLNIMSTRVISLITQDKDRWQLAGDQLFVDFDLSAANIPPGTQLALGSTIVEITDQPHTGCAKFKTRFGLDALKFISSPVGKALQLRGVNAKVIKPGTIQVGDKVEKL
ncbi:MAG: MOSC domain-containing protein [Candidatus Promineifilaceae bacterium]